ncbi:MAG: transporter family protein [Hydrocarboniphaga sp.]|uniref:ABC transporter ATP-binding protein n=1 Tax=Hydrocarboniphaga sp. TaxID=2033016 RepID=UPI0026394E6C|nr:ABC transporter ATP-binding protein [Hydrocarboniphaga sp.]MDB5970224.1 transporter family protein [Hydrocarboniphaga sp.]
MNPLLRLTGLCKAYGDVPVLEQLDLEIGAGLFCGLVGANGSGKSTLMRCIAGIEQADGGTIEIGGHSLQGDLLLARAALGYAVDVGSLPSELTGRQCLELVSQMRGLPSPDAEAFALAEALDLMPWLDRWVHAYSLGTRQKLSVVLALIGRPKLVLLDESLNGLDPVAAFTLKYYLRERVRSQGCSVLLATHAIESVEFWDRALLLDRSIVRQWNIAEAHISGTVLEREIVAVLSAGKPRL